jgi:hypothetical protein
MGRIFFFSAVAALAVGTVGCARGNGVTSAEVMDSGAPRAQAARLEIPRYDAAASSLDSLQGDAAVQSRAVDPRDMKDSGSVSRADDAGARAMDGGAPF